MLLLARRLAARAQAGWIAALGAAAGGVLACVPLNNLDDYSPAPEGAGGATSSPGETPGLAGSAGTTSAAPGLDEPEAPPGAGGSGTGTGSAGGGSGLGDGGSSGAEGGPSPPAPSNDGGSPAPVADAAPPASVCAAGELLGPDESCFFLEASAQTFLAARSACQARGSGWDLASVRSAEVSAFLGEALGFEAWLGASDEAREGTWVWIDDGLAFWEGGTGGAPIAGAYTNWNATEPNGGNLTSCMRALPRSAGSANPDAPWADLTCVERLGSVCRGPLRE